MNYTPRIAVANSTQFFPSWMARSKVTPVTQNVEIFSRPSLTNRLNLGLDSSLTLLHAPAGFGKSTALASWRERLLQDQACRVAWLSVDKNDHDPLQLVLYLAYSLHVAGVSLQAGSTGEFNDLSARRLLGQLHSLVERRKQRVVMILDDFEQLEPRAIREVIDPLIRYCPPNLHIALAGRRDGVLKITDLELRGMVNRLDADDLKFSYSELGEFFARLPQPKSIQHIYSITEGWPVAVQLLRRVIRREHDLSGLLAQISSDKGKLAAYLSEQVFDQLDEDSRAFLVDVSILERIDCACADFLRECHKSTEILEALKDLDALLTSIDNRGQAYRLHPIFREYLLDKLSSKDPDHVRCLNVRAGHWFREQGQLIKAVMHFVEGDDQEGAANCIEDAGGLILWLKDGLATLPSAMALLDQDTIRGRPRLSLAQCLLLAKTGQARQARQLYEDCARGVGQCEDLKLELAVTRHLLLAYIDQGPALEVLAGLEKSPTRIPPSEHAILGHHYRVLCGLNAFQANSAATHMYAKQAFSAFRSGGARYGEAYVHVHLGDLSYCRGLAKEAESHYKGASNILRRRFSDDNALRLIVNLLKAELRYDSNRLDLIPKLATEYSLKIQKREAWFNIHAAACVLSSNLAYIRNDLESALSILKAHQDFARQQELAGLQKLLTCQEATLLQRAGCFDKSARILTRSGLDLGTYAHRQAGIPGWREKNMVTQTILRQLIAQDELAHALSHLNRLIASTESETQVRSYSKYLIFRALVYHRFGEEQHMHEDFQAALLLASESKSIRIFLDEGEVVSDLVDIFLGEAKEGWTCDKSIEHAKLINEHSNGRRRASRPLTERELQILQELKQGYANKVIARRVGISHNTVRYHLKNIFVKLAVNTRLQAVGAASARKLI